MELNVPRPKRKYESIIILHPEMTEEDQKKFFQKNKEILSSYEGEYNHVDTWGKRRLANQIDKTRMGIYFHSTFEAKAEVIAELERTMRINEKVLRFFHKKLDDRVTLTKHIENYREIINSSIEREKEKEAKIAKKNASRSMRPSRDRDSRDRGSRDSQESKEPAKESKD